MHDVCESGIASWQASSGYVLLLRHPIDSSQRQIKRYQGRLFATIATSRLAPRFTLESPQCIWRLLQGSQNDLLQSASYGPRAALSPLTRGRRFLVPAGWVTGVDAAGEHPGGISTLIFHPSAHPNLKRPNIHENVLATFALSRTASYKWSWREMRPLWEVVGGPSVSFIVF